MDGYQNNTINGSLFANYIFTRKESGYHYMIDKWTEASALLAYALEHNSVGTHTPVTWPYLRRVEGY